MQRCAAAIPSLELPEIDGSWTVESAREAAGALRSACRETGYFHLRNHGIATETIASVIEEARLFLMRPLSEKAGFQSSAASQFLGYRRLGAERSLSHAGAEACEQYRIGNVLAAGKAPGVDDNLFNRPFPKGMKFLSTMTEIGDRLMRYAAIGLGESGIFDSFFDAPMHRLGLNLYEAGAGARIGNAVSYAMSPHVDNAVFTIVAQDEPGLEMLSPEGEWVQVPAFPGALFVFAGDYFQRWTNGRVRASLHRVGDIRRNRISIQYKHRPSHAVVVKPLAAFVSEDSPARYEPFDTGHQYERLLAALLADRRAG